MNNRNIGLYFFITIFLAVCVLSFFIFKPFLYPLILAIVFTTIFGPIHKKIFVAIGGKSGLAAFISTILVLIIVVVPLTFLGFQILREVSGLYSTLSSSDGTATLFSGWNGAIQHLIDFSPVSINVVPDVEQYLTEGLVWLSGHLGQIFLNVAAMGVDIFIFLVALYYLFKDGHRLKKAVVIFSPLKDVHDEAILGKLALAVKSVVGGNIVVALVQGMLTALGFVIFGVPNAVLWGSVAAIASLVPTVGTSLVIVPAILYLFFQGQTLFAGGMLIWGFVAVGLIDNYLGPKIASQGMRIHPLLVLLSVLGGIALFGPLGFIMGPLVLSLLGALIEIYFTIRREHEGY
jgi:predicted PurR-regulated permease PerM